MVVNPQVTGMKNCLCHTHKILKSIEARLYIEDHLELVLVNDNTGDLTYRCPDTGMLWQTKDPWSWLPGWGSKNLVKVTD
jgi:hypothetical protein